MAKKTPKVEVVDMKEKHTKDKDSKSKGADHKSSSHKSGHDHVAVKIKKKDMNTIRNSIIAIIVVVILALIIYAIIQNQQKTMAGEEELEGSTIAARLGETEISVDELNAEYELLPDVYKTMVTKRVYLENIMIPQKLLLMKAVDIPEEEVEELYTSYVDASGLSEEEIQEMLDSQGVDMAKFKDMLRIQAYLNETLYPRIEITDEEIEEFYELSKESLLDENNETMSFDEVEDQIRDYLYLQELQIETQNYIIELREETDIEIIYVDTPLDSEQTAPSVQQEMVQPSGMTFSETDDEICTEDGKPIIRLFSTTTCPHCKWISETYENTVMDYVNEGLIVARHWEFDTRDDTLTLDVEGEIPEEELLAYEKFSTGAVPTFVFGCKYGRLGNGYERQNDLVAEEAEFRKIIEELIAETSS